MATSEKQTEEKPEFQTYTAPNLTVFGDVSILTAAGGSKNSEEGNKGNNKPFM